MLERDNWKMRVGLRLRNKELVANGYKLMYGRVHIV